MRKLVRFLQTAGECRIHKEWPTHTEVLRAEPELWAGQRLGAQVLGKVQIRNAKELNLGDRFCQSAWHSPRKGRGQSKQIENL